MARRSVLLVEDTLDEAVMIRKLLREVLGYRVTLAQDGIRGCQLATHQRWDLVLTDLNLPGRTGGEVIRASIAASSGTPVLAITAHENYLQEAEDAGADEVLLKPLDREELLDVVRELTQGPLRRSMSVTRAIEDRRVLALGGLPGDVEAGCGGILLGHRAFGQDVTVVVMSSGGKAEDVEVRRAATERAAEWLGASLILAEPFEASIPSQATMDGLVREAIEEVRPDMIYLPSRSDIRPSRTRVHEAALASTAGTVSQYAYQSATTTLQFQPTLFVDIAERMTEKLELLAVYEAACDLQPHLRPEVVEASAQYWGRFLGYTVAEPLEVIRRGGSES